MMLLFPFLLCIACKEVVVTTLSADEVREQRFGDHGHFLRDSSRIEIYSIESTGMSIPPSTPPSISEFHGFKIYGKTLTENRSEIDAVWSEIHDRIYSKPGDSYTYCFWPRHGIRALLNDELRDYLICFECNHLYVYTNPTSEEFKRIGLETAGGAYTLDALLDSANIPRERPVSNKTEQAGSSNGG